MFAGLKFNNRMAGIQREGKGNKNGREVSRYKGVSFHGPKQLWFSRIRDNGKTRLLGYFKTEEEAAEKYATAKTLIQNGKCHCCGRPYAESVDDLLL